MAPPSLVVAARRRGAVSLVRLAILAMAFGFAFVASDSATAAPEVASFDARSDLTLTPGFVNDDAGIPLTTGVPVVFHSNGSQALEYPAGFNTVAGPFSGFPFAYAVFVMAAQSSSPVSVDLDFEIKNATTNQVITGFSGVSVDNIPLDFDDPPCADQFETAGTEFQITLAPPFNAVAVGPADDITFTVTPTAIFGGPVELCVDSSFYTGIGLVVEPVPVPNQPPVAALSAPAFVEATSPAGATVELDASGSSDPDDDPLNYEFSGPFGTIDNGSDPTLDVMLPFSPPSLASVVSVTVSDPDGESDTASATVIVQDTTPPSLTAPPDVIVSADDACTAAPDLGTATASDVASLPVTVSNDAPAAFPLGTTTVTWTAEDASGNVATATQLVTVVDTTAPTLSVSLSPDVLWSPDHKLVAVEATVEASDNCDPSPAVVLVSATNSEPDNGLGDGDTVNDIQGADLGTADFALQVRAERSALGDGRVYTIVYSAADTSGNSASAGATVTVPKTAP